MTRADEIIPLSAGEGMRSIKWRMRGAHWPRQQGPSALTTQCQLSRAGYLKPTQGVSVED